MSQIKGHWRYRTTKSFTWSWTWTKNTYKWHYWDSWQNLNMVYRWNHSTVSVLNFLVLKIVIWLYRTNPCSFKIFRQRDIMECPSFIPKESSKSRGGRRGRRENCKEPIEQNVSKWSLWVIWELLILLFQLFSKFEIIAKMFLSL